MTTELKQAFGHPEARAMAASGPVPDRISLRDHIVEVEIGAFQVERGQTQRLAFNIVVEVTPPSAPLDDDVDRILSYDKVVEAIQSALAAERLNLLETLAERIAARILTEPQALRTFVRIEKLDRGPGALGVEIMRAQAPDAAADSRPPAQATPPTMPPLVVFLAPSLTRAAALAGFLDLLQTGPDPLVICTGPPKILPVMSKDAEAARRIHLLSLDLTAWQLAGQDARLAVTGSRTELDWALGNKRPAIWAPSKMLLDAVAVPPADLSDGPGLAAWLAGQIKARALLFVGAKPPQGCNIPALTAALSDLTLPKLP